LASDWAFWRTLQKQFLGNFDRSTSGKVSIDRILSSIDRLFRTSEFPVIFLWNLSFLSYCPTETLENNKAKGLTSANQGVQIHNIWHSSYTKSYSTQGQCKRRKKRRKKTPPLCVNNVEIFPCIQTIHNDSLLILLILNRRSTQTWKYSLVGIGQE